MGSLFSSAEDDAPPAAWRLGGEREAIARRLGREEGGAVRWACRVDAVEPGSEAFEALRLTIDDERERARVLAFAKPADQKRALVSRVLVRRCARVGLVDAYEGVTRTARGKPYAVARGAPPHANFNFSVSHDGDYVLVASEPLALVGVDVCGGKQRCEALSESLEPYRAAFSIEEWDAFFAKGVDLDAFLALWAAKEAFAKALGQGLAYDLSRVGFAALTKSGRGPFASAHVVLDGRVDRRWRVDVAFLDDWHCAAVCRGPPGDGLLPFFAAPGAGRDGGPAWRRVLDEHRPPFKLVGL